MSSTVLTDAREQLIEAIEIETVVKVFAARSLPQADEAERGRREAAIQLALQAAADVPLEVARLCAMALTHAQLVARYGSRAAAHELRFALGLLNVGLAGARANLEARLTSLTDPVYTKGVVEEMARLSDEATTAVREAESLLEAPPA